MYLCFLSFGLSGMVLVKAECFPVEGQIKLAEAIHARRLAEFMNLLPRAWRLQWLSIILHRDLPCTESTLPVFQIVA